MKKLQDTELLQLVKGKLTRGDITSIAEKTGLSKVTISNHLTGKTKRPSYLILEVAVNIINKRKRDEARLAKKLES